MAALRVQHARLQQALLAGAHGRSNVAHLAVQKARPRVSEDTWLLQAASPSLPERAGLCGPRTSPRARVQFFAALPRTGGVPQRVPLSEADADLNDEVRAADEPQAAGGAKGARPAATPAVSSPPVFSIEEDSPRRGRGAVADVAAGVAGGRERASPWVYGLGGLD